MSSSTNLPENTNSASYKATNSGMRWNELSESSTGQDSDPGSVPGSVPGSAVDSGCNSSSSEGPETMLIGWREWVSLPQLGLPAIKAKIDTGARTSAIHAFDIQQIKKNGGQDWLAFSVQPVQRNVSIVCRCEAQLIDVRRVTDSGGHAGDRFFIETELKIGSHTRTIEMTLSQRTDMLFRMLLGRTAMVPGIQVEPSLSFSLGRMSARTLYAGITEGVVP
jgi:hypothetical protein